MLNLSMLGLQAYDTLSISKDADTQRPSDCGKPIARNLWPGYGMQGILDCASSVAEQALHGPAQRIAGAARRTA
jgi:hypothetical protein